MRRVGKTTIAAHFVNRLVKHGNNANKSVRVLSGKWTGFSAITFSQSLLASSPLSFYALYFAHLFTNVHNVCEINPVLAGSHGGCNLESTYFFLSQVCVRRRIFRWSGSLWFFTQYFSFSSFQSQYRKQSKQNQQRHVSCIYTCPASSLRSA